MQWFAMIDLLDVAWQGLPISYSLSDRDSEVVSLLEEEGLTSFTFDGLKRRLGLHPETLSRILSRLEEEGIVKKSAEGYQVTPKISKLKLQPSQNPESSVPLLQTYLPSDLVVRKLIASLKGKWFGILRWLGLSEGNDEITLKWITEDGGMQIAATISESNLTISAKFINENNLNLALKGAYQLMAYITKLSSRSPMATHVGFFGGDVYLSPA